MNMKGVRSNKTLHLFGSYDIIFLLKTNVFAEETGTVYVEENNLLCVKGKSGTGGSSEGS